MNRYDYANLVGDLMWLEEKGLITDLTTQPFDSERKNHAYVTSFTPSPIGVPMHFTAREAMAFVHGTMAARLKAGLGD